MTTNKEEILNLIKNIVECKGTEKQIDLWIDELERKTGNLEISDLIFWNEKDLSPEEIYKKVFDFKVIEL